MKLPKLKCASTNGYHEKKRYLKLALTATALTGIRKELDNPPLSPRIQKRGENNISK